MRIFFQVYECICFITKYVLCEDGGHMDAVQHVSTLHRGNYSLIHKNETERRHLRNFECSKQFYKKLKQYLMDQSTLLYVQWTFKLRVGQFGTFLIKNVHILSARVFVNNKSQFQAKIFFFKTCWYGDQKLRLEYILEGNLENLSVWIFSVPFSLKGSSKCANH